MYCPTAARTDHPCDGPTPYHYVITLQGGISTQPWTKTWAKMINVVGGAMSR
jgi:hypothetical protein